MSTTLLIGIALILAGMIISVSYYTIMFSYKKTDAVVTSCERREEYDSDNNRTIVYIIYTDYYANGEKYIAYGKMKEPYSVGESIALYYHKYNPNICRFENVVSQKTAIGFFIAAIGIVIVIYHLATGKEIITEQCGHISE